MTLTVEFPAWSWQPCLTGSGSFVFNFLLESWFSFCIVRTPVVFSEQRKRNYLELSRTKHCRYRVFSRYRNFSTLTARIFEAFHVSAEKPVAIFFKAAQLRHLDAVALFFPKQAQRWLAQSSSCHSTTISFDCLKALRAHSTAARWSGRLGTDPLPTSCRTCAVYLNWIIWVSSEHF